MVGLAGSLSSRGRGSGGGPLDELCSDASVLALTRDNGSIGEPEGRVRRDEPPCVEVLALGEPEDTVTDASELSERDRGANGTVSWTVGLIPSDPCDSIWAMLAPTGGLGDSVGASSAAGIGNPRAADTS